VDLYLGRVYEALDKPGLAVHHYERVVHRSRQLDPPDRVQLFRALGYLYFAEHQHAAAADVWSRAELIEADPEIRVRLASAHRRVGGRAEEARALLESVSPETLSSGVQALRLQELAALDRAAGELEAAALSLRLAWQRQEDAETAYELGQVRRAQERTEEEIAALELALVAAPENARYWEAAGYAYARAGRREDAIAAFERTLALDRDVLPVYEDLGYLHLRQSENDEAIARFEEAVDNRPYYPVRTENDLEELARTQHRLRGEARTLADAWDLSVYLAVRSEELPSTTTTSLTGGILPSQGGVEIAWAPPGIGRRAGRVFQLFGRVLGNLEPESVEPISETYQGGVGGRYKPLRRQNLYLSVERLFEIGDRSIDDWLVRGQFSTSFGEILDPTRSVWNHTTLYLDAGYYLDAEVAAYYGELRQGLTLRLGRRTLFTPHLVADGRVQDPDAPLSSYVEYGAGASFTILVSPDRRYRVERGAFELLVQYKLGELVDPGPELTDETFDGWVATGILRF
jgi:tetratricopeptide (TPR) repeat protein